jgi:pseudouridine kinase
MSDELGEPHVLLIGASLLDTKGIPSAGLEPGTSNPAFIRSARGGTARNVAENLALLGAEAILLTAVGDDITGLRLMQDTAAAGVNIDYVQVLTGQNTGGYMALLNPDGTLAVAMDDTAVMQNVSSDFLQAHEFLFAQAGMVFVDGSVLPEALNTAVNLARKHHIPLCADPSSSRLSKRITPHLAHLHLIVPNEPEAAAICQQPYEGHDEEKSLLLARQLNQRGVDIAVITQKDFGIVYATAEESGYLPAHYHEMVDSTGTGDAVTAAIIFGLLNQLDPIECIRLGAAAAGLTLQTTETVVPNLSLDMLYDHLV